MSDHQFENITRGIQRSSARVQVKNDPNRDIKYAIWAYFLLLIFEGALRKWFLPFLATPLLIIRDPIALWAIFKASRRELLPANIYILVLVPLAIVSIFTAVLMGHGNYLVAFFGARPLLFHVPFIFVMGNIMTKDDVIKIGRVLILISIPMTLLIALQFYSPQSSWVNRGVGGDEGGAGFSGSLGYYRPPGTFSFTNGNTLFYGLVSCFVFYFWLNLSYIHRWILIIATVCLVAAVPLSISRGLLFSVGVVGLFVLIASARKPKYFVKIIAATTGLLLALAILSQLSFFQTATEAFTTRFDNASTSEGGVEGTLGKRYIGGLLVGFSSAENVPFFGYGSGFYTNVGSKFLSGNVVGGLAEGEIGREIGELGLLMGMTVIVMRTMLCIKFFSKSYLKLSEGELLPWVILPYALLLGPQANWAQPTSLGFSIFTIGLVAAALNNRQRKKGTLLK